MDDVQNDVAAELRAILARRRLTNRRVALQLGWTETYLSRRLTGMVPLTVNDLGALAELLDLPISAFFDSPVPGEGSRNLRFSTPARAAA